MRIPRRKQGSGRKHGSGRWTARTRAIVGDPTARLAVAGMLLCLAVAALPSQAAGQTISGTLMDLDTDQPISLGLVMMFTESGDSIGDTITDAAGRFSLSSPQPGSFILLAAALGYRETPAGVFELGEDGVLTVEYRLPAEPLPIDEIIVSLDRPALQHSLVRNGFIRRLQQGMGVFITPHDIQESSALTTEMLLGGIPGVMVAPMFTGGGMPRPDIGDHVRLRNSTGSWCYPNVYLDGIRVHYDIEEGLTLSQLVDLQSVEGIEVYRRPLETPPEYATGQNECGVLVFWSRAGAARGERVTDLTALGIPASGGPVDPEGGRLPPVEEQGPPPTEGERIRVELDPVTRATMRITSPWEGTFVAVREGDLVGQDPTLGRPIALPLAGMRDLQVRRERPRRYALRRGAIAGAAFGTGMWLHLRILCRSGCDGVAGSAWMPATVTALLFGVLFAAQGPGEHWVSAPLPESAERPGDAAPLGGAAPKRVDVGLRLPVGGS